MEHSVVIKKLSKRYSQPENGYLTVLNNIDLEIQDKSFVAIIGQSGSGKSTLLNIIGLLDTPDTADKLEIGGVAIGQLSQEQRAAFRGKHIGFVFQFHQLLPEFSSIQNVMLPMRLRSVSKTKAKTNAMELLARVFTTEEMNQKVFLRKESQLSGGQCQRVAIARALANDPSIVLADEPTGSLDSQSAEKVMEILFQLPQTGTTVLMITHQIDIAKRSDSLYRLINGNIYQTNENHTIKDEQLTNSKAVIFCKHCGR